VTTIAQLLIEVEKREVILPEFQRGYVWQRGQVRDYIKSLYHKYPTGYFLIWKTAKMSTLSRGGQGSEEPMMFKLLLDGQQRLTSLYLLFKGEPPPFYEGEPLIFDNLYFNIESEEFEFWQPVKMTDNPAWIQVTLVLQKGANAFFEASDDLPDEHGRLYWKYRNRLNKLDSIRNYTYHVEVIPADGQEMSVDKIVEIFKLINSKGTKLSTADLALAHVCSDWPEARREFNHSRDLMKAMGFDLSLEFLVRCIAAVAVGRVVLEGGFYRASSDDLKKAWATTQRTLQYLVNLLRHDAYIDSSKVLTTPYVIIPLLVYLAKRKGVFESDREKKQFLYWLYAAQMWGRYSGTMESTLQADLNVLDMENPTTHLIENIKRVSGRLNVEAKDLQFKSVQSPFYKMSYIVARHERAIDWFTGLRLHSDNLGTPFELESHHIFPQSLLYKSGKYDSNDDRQIVNEIANRVFLTKKANLKISDSYPDKYLAEIIAKYPHALKAQFVPENSALWSLDTFQDFLIERRKLLAKAINDFMDGLLQDGKSQTKGVDIHALIAQGEHANLEFKSSARWDYKLKTHNKVLESVIVKTISGFLNAQGGQLLIGVADDGTILGLTNDYKTLGKKQDRDGYELYLTNLIANSIGKEFCTYIHPSFHDVSGEDVCLIVVEASHEPIYVKDDMMFYVRMGNSTQQLNTKEAHNYISSHWKQG